MKQINPHFNLIRLWIQENIGKFIVGLLIGVYLATALIIGLSLYHSFLPWLGAAFAGVCAGTISLGAQASRGSLVYFSQSNPYSLSNSGHIAGSLTALALTIYSCYEVYMLMGAANVPYPAIVSVVGVILCGFLVEVYFLGQLVKINNSIVANDPELLKELENEARNIAKAKIERRKSKMELILFRQDQLRKTYTPTLPENEKKPLPVFPANGVEGQ